MYDLDLDIKTQGHGQWEADVTAHNLWCNYSFQNTLLHLGKRKPETQQAIYWYLQLKIEHFFLDSRVPDHNGVSQA